jgi:streptogramin lyase
MECCVGDDLEDPESLRLGFEPLRSSRSDEHCGSLGTDSPEREVPALTEYSLPTAPASPSGIALGPDGNLWVTETTGNMIAKITSGGAITEYAVPTSNSQPVAIASGPDGNLWFTELAGNNVGQITAGGMITEYALPTLSAAPAAIAAGPDGKLWFVESMANKVGSITTSGTVNEYPVFANPAGICGGSRWPPLVHRTSREQDRSNYPRGCDYGISTDSCF